MPFKFPKQLKNDHTLKQSQNIILYLVFVLKLNLLRKRLTLLQIPVAVVYKRVLLGKCDTAMNFHSGTSSFHLHVFLYFSVFVYMIAKRHFVPIQVTPEILVLVRNFIMV